ncbi:MAG TPA: type VI secretion system baseplate subunit TssG [Polyangiaceae bacterium]|jgi:type VI secretion system protein ImpH
MASPQRQPDDDLKQSLASGGTRFSFFPAVFLLQRLWPDAVPLGELGPVAKEAVRFRHDHRLIFNPGDVSSIVLRRDRQGRISHAELTETFIGLTGTVSPLSAAMLEDVLQAEANDEPSLRAFYDLFHHRIASLFFRAWKKYRFAASFRVGGDDIFTRRALAFVGIDSAGPTPDSGLGPLEQLALAPLLALRVRSGRTLEVVLRRAIGPLAPGAHIWVEPFVQRRVEIDQEERVALGVRSTTLAVDMVIGPSVMDQSGRFRVHIAPVSHDVYESLMPGGRHYSRVRNVIEFFSRGHLEAELEVEVEGKSSGFVLGSERSSRLGATTQLGEAGAHALRMRVLLSENLAEAKPYAVREPSN